MMSNIRRAILLMLLLAGCGLPAANNPTPASVPKAKPPRNADIRVSQNDLLLDGQIDNSKREPIEISAKSLAGEWIVHDQSSRVRLTFGREEVNAWTLDKEGKIAQNPDGNLALTFDGSGLLSSTLAWGLEAEQQHGWIASPYSADGPPFERSAEFRLLAPDLLHVQGTIEMHTGALVELNSVFVRSPGPETYIALVSAEDPQLPKDDPIAEAQASDFRGTWVAALKDRTVTLRIGETVLIGVQVEKEGETPQSWQRTLQLDAAKHRLQFRNAANEVDEYLDLTREDKLLLHSAASDRGIVFERRQK